jgi:hypothetical protein
MVALATAATEPLHIGDPLPPLQSATAAGGEVQFPVSGIKSGIPQTLWERTLLLYKDEALWKTRLSMSSDKHAYVILLRWRRTRALDRLDLLQRFRFRGADQGQQPLILATAPGTINLYDV